MLYLDWTNDLRRFGAAVGAPEVIHKDVPRVSQVTHQEADSHDETTEARRCARETISLSVLRSPAVRHGFTPTNRGSWVQLPAPHHRAS